MDFKISLYGWGIIWATLALLTFATAVALVYKTQEVTTNLTGITARPWYKKLYHALLPAIVTLLALWAVIGCIVYWQLALNIGYVNPNTETSVAANAPAPVPTVAPVSVPGTGASQASSPKDYCRIIFDNSNNGQLTINKLDYNEWKHGRIKVMQSFTVLANEQHTIHFDQPIGGITLSDGKRVFDFPFHKQRIEYQWNIASETFTQEPME